MKRNIKFLSLFLAVLLAFSVFPFSTAYAVEGTETVDTRQTEEFALPDIVPEEEAVERGYIGRVKEEEKDNFTFVFKDSENMRTMRVYSHPVKYTDKDGNTKDITLDIQSRPGGGFETKDNSIKTTFGAKLSDGIRLQSEDVDIKLIPANSLNRATLSEDSKTVSYTLDEKTSLEYSLTYTGFKEDIVVNEYTGQTEYEFLLYTNGLTVKEEMGSFYLADEQGNRKANIGDIIIFTADERNNTLGKLSCIEIKENQIYGLTIHVDAEYLKDEKTVYPIRIDPTLEVTGTGAIEDVTVYTGTSYYSGTSGILYIGRSNGKTYRALMRFPGLELPVDFPEMITSAKIELRDVMCQGTHVPIICTPYPAIAAGWSESTTSTWNSTQQYYTSNKVLDEQVVYYGNGNVPGIPHRYAFDITEEARNWVTGPSTPDSGVVFRMSDSFAAQTPSTTQDELKYFGSYNRSDYQPSLTIEYRCASVDASPTTVSLQNLKTKCFVQTNGTAVSFSESLPFDNGKWQLVFDGIYYHIVCLDINLSNGKYAYALTYKYGTLSMDEYDSSDVAQKWYLSSTTLNNAECHLLTHYSGYHLAMLQTSTSVYLSMTTTISENAGWKLHTVSNQYAMINTTNGYIDKINNSSLINQMNCYAYALGVYHKYEPRMIPKGGLGDAFGSVYYWYTQGLQPGEISGNVFDYDTIYNTSGYYTQTTNQSDTHRSLTYSGKAAMTKVIIDALEADLSSVYSVNNKVLPCGSNTEVPISGWRKVALVMTTQNRKYVEGYGVNGFEYHWFVQLSDGSWTQKNGAEPVTRYYDDGTVISDPAQLIDEKYDYFAGYYLIRCDYVLKEAFGSNSDGAGDVLTHAKTLGTIGSNFSAQCKIEYGTNELWKGCYWDENGTAYWYEYDIGNKVKKLLKSPAYSDTATSVPVGEFVVTNDYEDVERANLYYSKSITTVHNDAASTQCDVDFYEFMVQESGSYTIYTQTSTVSALGTYGKLYKESMLIASNDSSGTGGNFSITATLEPNVVYRISVMPDDLSIMGEYTLVIKKLS